MALPRYETVGWAARVVRDLGAGGERPRADADALKATLLWVQDPTEPRRRGAFDAAQLADMSCAERLAALAAFLSGGSMAPRQRPTGSGAQGGARPSRGGCDPDRRGLRSGQDRGDQPGARRWRRHSPAGTERENLMTLTLVITNVERLDNGVATRIRLDRHGAVIGRSPTADWSLPDPQHYISSVHCEVDYPGRRLHVGGQVRYQRHLHERRPGPHGRAAPDQRGRRHPDRPLIRSPLGARRARRTRSAAAAGLGGLAQVGGHRLGAAADRGGQVGPRSAAIGDGWRRRLIAKLHPPAGYSVAAADLGLPRLAAGLRPGRRPLRPSTPASGWREPGR